MTPRFSRLLKKSESAIVWISARPAVTPYQKHPQRHSEVGLDRRASRGFFNRLIEVFYGGSPSK